MADTPDVPNPLPSAEITDTTPQAPPTSQKKAKTPKAPKPAKSTPAALPLSPALIDLRVGHILHCEPHTNADSLYTSTIALGDPEGTENTQVDAASGRVVRTICSGLRGIVPLEEMQGRRVVVLANLKPVTMRGVKSAGMVLAASPVPVEVKQTEGEAGTEGGVGTAEGEVAKEAKVVELVDPPAGSEGGDAVFFEGWGYGEGKGPEKILNSKKKQWEAVQKGLFTDKDLQVVFDPERVEGVQGEKGLLVVEGKGKCTVKSLTGARLS